MAFIQCSFYSHILGMECNANVILPLGRKNVLPTAKKTDIPVLYLIHGFTEDYSVWIRRTSVERYASDKNIAIVMPNVHRSFCIDAKYGLQYFKFVSEELPCIMQNMFGLSAKREDNFTAGLSMGGYSALKIALSCPDRFCAAASLSGAVDINRVFNDKDHINETRAFFGDKVEDCNDLYYLASHADPMPAVYQACGTDDFMYYDNRKFSEFMSGINYNYVYTEEEGIGHTWTYWDKEIKKVLEWIQGLNDRV